MSHNVAFKRSYSLSAFPGPADSEGSMKWHEMARNGTVKKKLFAIRRRTRLVRSTPKRGEIYCSSVGLFRMNVCAHAFTYSLTHLLTYSLTHLLTYFLHTLCEGLVRVQQMSAAQGDAASWRRTAGFKRAESCMSARRSLSGYAEVCHYRNIAPRMAWWRLAGKGWFT